MSTFDGVVREYPFIQIDKFNVFEAFGSFAGRVDTFPVQAWLLSHIHTDHLVGLQELCRQVKDGTMKPVKIYTSEATAILLKKMRDTRSGALAKVLGEEAGLDGYDYSVDEVENLYKEAGTIYDLMDDFGNTLAYPIRFPGIENMLHVLPVGKPTILPSFVMPWGDTVSLSITLVSANHCSGAVMFLLEPNLEIHKSTSSPSSDEEYATDDSFKKRTRRGKPVSCRLPTIIYTGDARLERKYTNSLVDSLGDVFRDKNDHLKVVDTIYLDTTFAMDKNMYFPEKSTSISNLCHYLDKESEKWKKFCEENKLVDRPLWIHMACDIFGYEEIICKISQLFKKPIYLSPYRVGMYRELLKNKTVVQQRELMCMDIDTDFLTCITDNPTATHIHSCSDDSKCEMCQEHADAWLKMDPSLRGGFIDVSLTAYSWKYFRISDAKFHSILREHEDVFVTPDGQTRMECVRFHNQPRPNREPHPVLHVIWSMHSSLDELLWFVEKLCPRQVHPCVVHRGNSKVSGDVEVLFARYLRKENNVVEPSFSAPMETKRSYNRNLPKFRSRSSSPFGSPTKTPPRKTIATKPISIDLTSESSESENRIIDLSSSESCPMDLTLASTSKQIILLYSSESSLKEDEVVTPTKLRANHINVDYETTPSIGNSPRKGRNDLSPLAKENVGQGLYTPTNSNYTSRHISPISPWQVSTTTSSPIVNQNEVERLRKLHQKRARESLSQSSSEPGESFTDDVLMSCILKRR